MKIRFDLTEEHPTLIQKVETWFVGGSVNGRMSDKVTWNAFVHLPNDIKLAFSGDLPYKGMPEIWDAEKYVKRTVINMFKSSLEEAFDQKKEI